MARFLTEYLKESNFETLKLVCITANKKSPLTKKKKKKPEIFSQPFLLRYSLGLHLNGQRQANKVELQ